MYYLCFTAIHERYGLQLRVTLMKLICRRRRDSTNCELSHPAIGAFAIAKLAIRHLSVESAKFKSLEIDDLTVRRLRVAEVTVSDSPKLPISDAEGKIS